MKSFADAVFPGAFSLLFKDRDISQTEKYSQAYIVAHLKSGQRLEEATIYVDEEVIVDLGDVSLSEALSLLMAVYYVCNLELM